MGSFFGVAFVYNAKGFSAEELREKLRTMSKAKNKFALSDDMKKSMLTEMEQNFKENSDDFETSIKEYEARRAEIKGIPDYLKSPPPIKSIDDVMSMMSSLLYSDHQYDSKMFFSGASKWVCISNDDTMRVEDVKMALDTAKRYAAHFGMAAIEMAVFDSDASYIGYCDPEIGTAKSYKHGMDEDGDENSPMPGELFRFIKEDAHAALKAIWEAEYIFEDNLLGEVAKLLGIPAELVCNNEDITPPDGFGRIM